jgi:F-type H+-transporting ATPase subunit a
VMNIAFGFINLFVGVLEVFSHLIRMLSFTFRLFGNMTAGEILILVSCFLIPLVFTIPFYGLELLIGLIQALIFSGLTLVFGTIAVSPHEEAE